MVSVFSFLDYREYLSAWFEAKKAECPWYSLKVMGNGVDLDASQVYRILQKQLHLSKAATPRFKQYLELHGVSGEYFEKLVQFGRCRKESEARLLFQKILSMRGTRSRILGQEQSRLYETWYHPVVRALVNIFKINDNYELLARAVSPAITPAQAKKSLELLRQLKLVDRDDQGVWFSLESSVQTGSQVHTLLIRDYHAQSLKLAMESLERHPKESRDINVINMAVDQDGFEDCLHILTEARHQMRLRIEKIRQPDRIMRLAHAFFPVASMSEGI